MKQSHILESICGSTVLPFLTLPSRDKRNKRRMTCTVLDLIGRYLLKSQNRPRCYFRQACPWTNSDQIDCATLMVSKDNRLCACALSLASSRTEQLQRWWTLSSRSTLRIRKDLVNAWTWESRTVSTFLTVTRNDSVLATIGKPQDGRRIAVWTTWLRRGVPIWSACVNVRN